MNKAYFIDMNSRELTEIADAGGRVNALGFQANSTSIPLPSSSSPNEFRRYNFNGKSYSQTMHHNPESWLEAIFVADQREIVTIGSDRSLRIWEISQLEPAFQYDLRGANAVLDVLPNGEIIISSRNTNGMAVLEFVSLLDGRSLASLPLAGNLGKIAVTASGNRFVLTTEPDKLLAVDIHRSETGEWKFAVREIGEIGKIAGTWTGLYWLPDGVRLLVAQEAGARIIDINTLEQKWLTRQGDCSQAAVSDNGGLIACIGSDGTRNRVRIWNTGDGALFDDPLLQDITFLGFSRDAAKYLFLEEEHGVGRAYDLGRKQFLPHTFQHDRAIGAFDFSKQGDLATASHDGLVRLWDIRTGEEKLTPIRTGGVGYLRFNSKGDVLLASTKGGLRFWDVNTGYPLGQPLIGAHRFFRFLTHDQHQFVIAADGHQHVMAWRIPRVATATEHDINVWFSALSEFGPESPAFLPSQTSFHSQPVANF